MTSSFKNYKIVKNAAEDLSYSFKFFASYYVIQQLVWTQERYGEKSRNGSIGNRKYFTEEMWDEVIWLSCQIF